MKRTSRPLTRGQADIATDLAASLAWLKSRASESYRQGLSRYGIPNEKALGVAVGDVQRRAKEVGKSQPLAEALWQTDIYEARLLAAFVGEPDALTSKGMDRWCRDFDNWGICDTVCFHLFDRSPLAFSKVEAWSKYKDEFPKRGAFALLSSLALHDPLTVDEVFLGFLARIENEATDARNFVKKAVSWALRSMGHRSPALHAAALALATQLAASPDASSRWVGKDAVRDLARPAVASRAERRGQQRVAKAAKLQRRSVRG